MPLINQLVPLNFLEEKAKFMADYSYNPQFIYEELIDPQKLVKQGFPQKEYLKLAQKIVDKAYLHRNEQDLLMMKGHSLTQEEVTAKIKHFLHMHGLEKRFEIVWSSSFVLRAAINATTIKLKLPVKFRKEELLGTIYHEIGTHAIRRINYEKQPWYKKKKKFGLSDYLPTEEGLAVLHSLIPETNKSAYVSAVRYLAIGYALKHSFSETFKFLSKYIDDEERCWTITFRQKRGFTDTSQPGAFTKDLVYFAGMVDVWRYLKKNKFDITQLYFGKMALEDVKKAVAMNPDFKPLLPSFFTLDKQKYIAEMEKIGQENGL